MKLLVLLSLVMGAQGALALVQRGPWTGGGGFVVACPETPVSSASLELLDLYEAREALRFTPIASTGNLVEDHFAAIRNTFTLQGYAEIAESERENIRANLVKFMRSVKFVDKASDMPKANDLGEHTWIPSQCSLEQIAYFDDSSATIFIVKPLWDRLDTLNQAALVIHELWWKEGRNQNEKSSRAARITVGHVFAGRGVVSITDGLARTSRQLWASVPTSAHGSTEVSSFHATYMTGMSEIVRLQFSSIAGRSVLSKTWADLPAVPLELKFTMIDGEIGCEVLTPNYSSFNSAKVEGTSVESMTVGLKLETGKLARLLVYRDGELTHDAAISGCN